MVDARAVVGAPGAGPSNAGRVQFLERASGAWGRALDDVGEAGDELGTSVAMGALEAGGTRVYRAAAGAPGGNVVRCYADDPREPSAATSWIPAGASAWAV